MSRTRKPFSTDTYGLVNIVCPDGHVVGRVMAKDTGKPAIIDGTFKSRDYRRQPLATTCPRCEAAGIFRDLRGSWTKVFALAETLREDPQRGTGTYALGG